MTDKFISHCYNPDTGKIEEVEIDKSLPTEWCSEKQRKACFAKLNAKKPDTIPEFVPYLSAVSYWK